MFCRKWLRNIVWSKDHVGDRTELQKVRQFVCYLQCMKLLPSSVVYVYVLTLAPFSPLWPGLPCGPCNPWVPSLPGFPGTPYIETLSTTSTFTRLSMDSIPDHLSCLHSRTQACSCSNFHYCKQSVERNDTDQEARLDRVTRACLFWHETTGKRVQGGENAAMTSHIPITNAWTCSSTL
jgi:hypothetical protein